MGNAYYSATFARLIEGGFLLKWTSDEMDKVARIAEESSSSSSEPKPFVFAQIEASLKIRSPNESLTLVLKGLDCTKYHMCTFIACLHKELHVF